MNFCIKADIRSPNLLTKFSLNEVLKIRQGVKKQHTIVWEYEYYEINIVSVLSQNAVASIY